MAERWFLSVCYPKAIQTDGRVAVRDAPGGVGTHTFLDHPGAAWAMVFSPDGRALAVGGDGPDILPYDLDACGAGHPLGMSIHQSNNVAFSPDGRTLAASSWLHHQILLRDLTTGREQARLQCLGFPVISLAFAADGRSLASGMCEGGSSCGISPRASRSGGWACRRFP